jgi:hypothetical protein
MRKPLLLGVLIALALPATSLADTKTVSADAKKATFAGTVDDPAFGLYDLALFFNEGTEVRGQSVCAEPVCDTHTLTVGPDGAELELHAVSSAYNLSLEIIDPDGAHTSVNEVEPTSEHTLDFSATPGDWTIRVYGSADSGSFDYDLDATYKTAADVEAEQPVEEAEPEA